jgi:excisionase family DNA binding protein
MFINPNSKTMTIDEASMFLAVPRNTLERWIRNGRIDSDKSSRPQTLKKTDVEEFKMRLEQDTLKKRIIEHKRLDGRSFMMARTYNANVVPSGFHLLTKYEQLTQYTRAFANGDIPLMLLIGSPGGGKTEQMKADLGVGTHKQKCTWIASHLTPIKLYASVYKAQDRPVVIDDVVHFLKKGDAQSLVKSLAQSTKIKHIEWGAMGKSSMKLLDEHDVPPDYNTTSHLCFIANKWEESNVDLLAIRDRAAGRVAFYPSNQDLHQRVCEIGFCSDEEIMDFMEDHLDKISDHTMRTYTDCMTWKRAGFDWRKTCLEIWGLDG